VPAHRRRPVPARVVRLTAMPAEDPPGPASRQHLSPGHIQPRLLHRAGSVLETQLNCRAHCIDGKATAANQRIADALGIRDAEPDLDDEDDDTEQAS
jgi:hypothetical protein